MMIKQIEAKDEALDNKNEKLVQMQAAIEGLTKTLEPLNRTFETVSTCKAEVVTSSKWAEKLLAMNLVSF